MPWHTRKRQRRLKTALASTLAIPLLLASPAVADVDSVFQNSCAGQCRQSLFSSGDTGCHVNGGNVLGGRTLKRADLEATGKLDADALFDVISAGDGRMPGFGIECQPAVSSITSGAYLLSQGA